MGPSSLIELFVIEVQLIILGESLLVRIKIALNLRAMELFSLIYTLKGGLFFVFLIVSVNELHQIPLVHAPGIHSNKHEHR